MTRQPKTPRTRRHQVRYWLHPDSFAAWYGRYRRLPKGRRAKSGQWWRRTKPAWLGVDWGIEGEDRTVRRCEPKMRTNA